MVCSPSLLGSPNTAGSTCHTHVAEAPGGKTYGRVSVVQGCGMTCSGSLKSRSSKISSAWQPTLAPHTVNGVVPSFASV